MYTPRPNASPEERLAVIEEIVGELKDELLGGNGQPGKLALFDARIDKLEHWRSGIGGIMMFLGGLATVGGAAAGVMAIINLFKHL